MVFESAAAYLDALRGDTSLAVISMQMAADVRGVTRAAIDRMVQLGQLDEIKVGTTRCVRAKSLLDFQDAYEDRITIVRRYLEECAQERHITTYQPVMLLIGYTHTNPAHRKAIGAILGDVSRQTWREHKIVLSVIVHLKTSGPSRPSVGFMELAVELGLPKIEDEDALIAREMERVWEFYARHRQGARRRPAGGLGRG
jgi:hypothetical protein